MLFLNQQCFIYLIMNNLEIKKIRKSLKLNQKSFAKMLGVGERAVQTWESGERNISGSAKILLDMILKSNEQNSVYKNINITDDPTQNDSSSIESRLSAIHKDILELKEMMREFGRSAEKINLMESIIAKNILNDNLSVDISKDQKVTKDS